MEKVEKDALLLIRVASSPLAHPSILEGPGAESLHVFQPFTRWNRQGGFSLLSAKYKARSYSVLYGQSKASITPRG